MHQVHELVSEVEQGLSVPAQLIKRSSDQAVLLKKLETSVRLHRVVINQHGAHTIHWMKDASDRYGDQCLSSVAEMALSR